MVSLIRLKELRVKSGMTQKQMASILGIQEVSYQRLEYGSSRPHLENLVKLADFFDVSIDYLVGRSDDPARH